MNSECLLIIKSILLLFKITFKFQYTMDSDGSDFDGAACMQLSDFVFSRT